MSTGISPNSREEILKLVIYRPHDNIWFKNPVRNILKKQLLPNKYGPFLDYLLASKHKIYFTTKLSVDGGFKNLIKAFLEPFELLLWCLLNGISINRVGFIYTKNCLIDKDVLILMHFGTFTHEDDNIAKHGQNLAKYISSLSICKLVHMTHYAYQPAIGASNLKISGAELLVAENNLLRNSIFYRQYFGHLNAEFWCLPFVAAERFKSHIPFNDRACKLVATGSITYKMTDPDFINFFNTDELQPIRRQIYERAGDYAAEFDSMISDLNITRVLAKVNKDLLWHRVFRRFMRHPQQSYYKKNVVDIYNSYMMFAVPEEICDLPAIGVVEGMACGCAYFGLDSPMYRDLGMVPGIHYVAYDGTLKDMVEKIRFYQQPSHFSQLEKIAECGRKLVSGKFRAEFVYQEFMEHLNDHILTSTANGTSQ